MNTASAAKAGSPRPIDVRAPKTNRPCDNSSVSTISRTGEDDGDGDGDGSAMIWSEATSRSSVTKRCSNKVTDSASIGCRLLKKTQARKNFLLTTVWTKTHRKKTHVRRSLPPSTLRRSQRFKTL